MRSVACSKRVQFLRPVLKTFLANLERYAEAQGWEDFAHAYNEQATLSLLAAAFWQSDLIAIEEYTNWKGRGQDASQGRGDLWARCPKTDNEIVIEAKQQKTELGTHDKTIRGALDAAATDAFRNRDAALRAGLTFFTPEVRTGTGRDAVIDLFDRIRTIALEYGVDALVLWYPEEAMRNPDEARSQKQSYMFPGIIAALRIAAVTGQRPIPNSERLPTTHRFRSVALA
ncbi:hypothetical protein [Azospirillum rugosum]|uniref:Restriction endonuclease BglII n=1 Tax=Azospirillum rugosum TaxID=416170 RepID=A0ABS4SRV4_9PROT|nr:hypothetical protein [Azospirillum rugosum]MBP2294115.1 hypothetical protein [Azospirillum rugosum]MDQ0527496.1 hypothetical protein [Azospirillum rugosum]